jgi:hypothetical protein
MRSARYIFDLLEFLARTFDTWKWSHQDFMSEFTLLFHSFSKFANIFKSELCYSALHYITALISGVRTNVKMCNLCQLMI